MYAIYAENDDKKQLAKGIKTKEIQRAKRVKTSVRKTTLTFDKYEDCLFNQKKITVNQNLIRSRLHVLRTEKQEKIGLSSHDDRR